MSDNKIVQSQLEYTDQQPEINSKDESLIDKLERMNIVIVGHVDHGKSTFIGRLLADTDTLPKGKLDQVKAMCAANAKPFEYAFLLDALKDERSQGITIDTARSFFKSEKRNYIIIDAPGHIEFLKNMITGAARAEAAILVIDAHEGVQENSRRHGYMLSLLGIRQIIVCVNKMDLVDNNEEKFNAIVKEYQEFLDEINLTPLAYVPISAREGDNLISPSESMSWYKGGDVLSWMDKCEKQASKENQPFRFPVQDVYKFTEEGDDRRVFAGTVETGTINDGDDIVFLPSNKEATITSIEGFNLKKQSSIGAGYATGFTISPQLYIKPGELICKKGETPAKYGTNFKANLFWLGKNPLVQNKKYKIKIGAARATVYLKEIIHVLDASALTTESSKSHVGRHDVAECVFQTLKPIAYDISSDIESTGRFVIIDDYEIAGGGIISESIDSTSRLEDVANQRQFLWEKSEITAADRARQMEQTPTLILLAGPRDTGKIDLAKILEESLFKAGKKVYYLGLPNMVGGVSSDIPEGIEDRDEHIRRLGELSHLFTDAGMILISTISDLDSYEIKMLKTLLGGDQLVVVYCGEHEGQFPVDCVVSKSDIEAPEGSIQKILDLVQSRQDNVDYFL